MDEFGEYVYGDIASVLQSSLFEAARSAHQEEA